MEFFGIDFFVFLRIVKISVEVKDWKDIGVVIFIVFLVCLVGVNFRRVVENDCIFID